MATRGRPPRIQEDTLLDAARDVLLRDGVAATTAEIARRAGVSEGLLFYRYATKEALVLAVLDRQMRFPARLADLLGRAGEGTLVESLCQIGGELMAFQRATFPFVELARAVLDAPALRKGLGTSAATPERIVTALARHVEAEQRLGRLRRVDARMLARVFSAAIMHRVFAQHLPEPGAFHEDDATFLLGLADILLNGALPPAPRPDRAKSPR